MLLNVPDALHLARYTKGDDPFYCAEEMRRLFGRAKEQPPAPTLEDASGNVRTYLLLVQIVSHLLLLRRLPRPQLDKRGSSIDERIKKLDDELRRHKEVIQKSRPGPAQVLHKDHSAVQAQGDQFCADARVALP